MKRCYIIRALMLSALATHVPITLLSKERPLIKSMYVQGNSIVVFPHKKFVKTFLKNSSCRVTYNCSIDLSNVPNDILALPFIMTAAPFIWASGKHYTLNSIDSDTAHSLEKVHHILKLFYPSSPWSGSLTAQEQKTYTPKERLPDDEVMLFFSGGLDSMCTSFSHFEKKQLLITFFGLDVQLKEKNRWDKVFTWCNTFATHHNRELIDVSFNLNNNFRASVASRLVPEIDNYVDWWGNVMLGLAHMGIVAPLAYARGHHTVLIGSSSTIDHPEPEATCPLIDNNIKCAGIQLVHDGETMTRPEKIVHIAKQAERYHLSLPALRVCQTDKQGKNCTFCSFKCLMTSHNILAAGQDLASFDFINDLKKIETATKKFFSPGKKIPGGKLWEWKCSQDYARAALAQGTLNYKHDVKKYLEWFCSLNLNDYEKDDGGVFERNKEWWTLLWKQAYINDDSALFALKPRTR